MSSPAAFQYRSTSQYFTLLGRAINNSITRRLPEILICGVILHNKQLAEVERHFRAVSPSCFQPQH